MAAPLDTGLPTNILQSLSITYTSATAAAPGQLVGYNGALAVLPATPVYGVLRSDVVQNGIASVAVAGMCEITSGAAVTVGAPISADSTGRGIVAVTGAYCFARALTATSAAGQKFQAIFSREGVI
jgi:hypothetical protein